VGKLENYAAIDVGSNQVLIYIASVTKGKIAVEITDRGIITKLGEDVGIKGILKIEAMDRTLSALKTFNKLIIENKVRSTAAVGTAALRIAENSGDFLERVKKETGLDISIISGEEEARLAFLAVSQNLSIPKNESVILDIGGASTEFIYSRDENVIDLFSLETGALVLTENFLKSDPVKDTEYIALQSYFKGELEKISHPFKDPLLAGIGGTMSTLGAMKHKMDRYNPRIVHGTEIGIKEIDRMAVELLSKTINERKKLKGLQPERAGLILAGVSMLKAVMNKLGVDKVVISDKGIRHALFYERFLKKTGTN
jgi:exopolyphosphatase/guanosine-5'-triphosphate,3'-diphosphate pyrophosphatase